MAKKRLSPDAARDFLVRRFENQHQSWLAGQGIWPLGISLGMPTEQEVTDDPRGVRAWVNLWAAYSGSGAVSWEERRWGRLGLQRLPAALVLASPAEVAAAVGQTRRWATALARQERLLSRWPALSSGSVLASRFSVLADAPAEDFERLVSLLSWLQSNPASSVYLRQLPVEGLDTKWFEQRKGLVAGLLRAILAKSADENIYALCGLLQRPHRIRIRILCPFLRRVVGGLRDIEAPLQELALLQMTPSSVVIVENLETGLALPDLPGAVAFMKLGNAVSVLGALPWLGSANVVYWGDIDTYGYFILDQARQVLPRLRSVLMDEATLLAHRPLWGREPVQCPESELPHLLDHERAVYQALRHHTFAPHLRLEQERLPWGAALQAVRGALV